MSNPLAARSVASKKSTFPSLNSFRASILCIKTKSHDYHVNKPSPHNVAVTWLFTHKAMWQSHDIHMTVTPAVECDHHVALLLLDPTDQRWSSYDGQVPSSAGILGNALGMYAYKELEREGSDYSTWYSCDDHAYPPVTIASLSPSLLFLILTNSCWRLSAVSVFRSTNSLTGWFRLTAANSST